MSSILHDSSIPQNALAFNDTELHAIAEQSPGRLDLCFVGLSVVSIIGEQSGLLQAGQTGDMLAGL